MKHIKKLNEIFELDESSKVNELVFDGFKAFRIPDDKRDDYFDFIDRLIEAAPRASDTIDAYNDPIIIFHDMTLYSQKNQEAILAFMNRIGAKDVTSAYEHLKIQNL